jgi:hypothetical protein
MQIQKNNFIDVLNKILCVDGGRIGIYISSIWFQLILIE